MSSSLSLESQVRIPLMAKSAPSAGARRELKLFCDFNYLFGMEILPGEGVH